MVRATKKAATKVAKSSSSSAPSRATNLECYPPFRRNGAKASSETILTSAEQSAYKKYSTEVKQISGLIILTCGLGVAEKKHALKSCRMIYFSLLSTKFMKS